MLYSRMMQCLKLCRVELIILTEPSVDVRGMRKSPAADHRRVGRGGINVRLSLTTPMFPNVPQPFPANTKCVYVVKNCCSYLFMPAR
jgi:hypothetical protein